MIGIQLATKQTIPRQKAYILPCYCWCSGPAGLLSDEWKDAAGFCRVWVGYIGKSAGSYGFQAAIACASPGVALLSVEWWGETLIRFVCSSLMLDGWCFTP